jgi:pSer/pThr/pTyr-binding forkhead associated (FHA) protein
MDEMVSRKHAVVDAHDDAYYFTDLGGLNGSSINEAIVPAFVGVRLNARDVVLLGKTKYICMEIDERCVCS